MDKSEKKVYVRDMKNVIICCLLFASSQTVFTKEPTVDSTKQSYTIDSTNRGALGIGYGKGTPIKNIDSLVDFLCDTTNPNRPKFTKGGRSKGKRPKANIMRTVKRNLAGRVAFIEHE